MEEAIRNALVVQWNSATDEFAIYTNVAKEDIPTFVNSFIGAIDTDDNPCIDRNLYTVCVIWDPATRKFTFSDNCGSLGLVVGILINTVEALPRLARFPVTDYVRKVTS